MRTNYREGIPEDLWEVIEGLGRKPNAKFGKWLTQRLS